MTVLLTEVESQRIRFINPVSVQRPTYIRPLRKSPVKMTSYLEMMANITVSSVDSFQYIALSQME